MCWSRSAKTQIVALLQRALADDERGLGALELTADDDALRTIAATPAATAATPYNTLEVAANLARSPQPQAHHQGDCHRSPPAARPALRQAGRGALQPHLRPAQNRAQLRRRRLALLAGRMFAGRRRPHVRRPPRRSHGRRRHRPRRSRSPQPLPLRRDAMDFLGSPEGDLALAQAVVYLALAPKSNAVYTAYGAVLADIEATRSRTRPAAPAQRSHRADEVAGLRQGLPVRPRRGGSRRRHGLPAPTRSPAAATTTPPRKAAKNSSPSAWTRSPASAKPSASRNHSRAPHSSRLCSNAMGGDD